MPKQLTIRGVPDEVGRRLEELSRERQQSVNRTVIEILEEAFSYDRRRLRLERYATWTADDAESFDQALAAQRVIDDELWR
jgi:predicted transcriptional regulator